MCEICSKCVIKILEWRFDTIMVSRFHTFFWCFHWWLWTCKQRLGNTGSDYTSRVISSVIRQKGESQNGCSKKTKHVKFSEKTNISNPLIRTRSQSCIKTKINLNFYFHTSLWCVKRFYEGPKALIFILIQLCERVCIRGLEMFVFSENLTCFVFLEHPFWDSPFYLIADDYTVHCVESAHIRSFSGPYSPAFGFSVFSPNAEKTPNTDTFCAVVVVELAFESFTVANEFLRMPVFEIGLPLSGLEWLTTKWGSYSVFRNQSSKPQGVIFSTVFRSNLGHYSTKPVFA